MCVIVLFKILIVSVTIIVTIIAHIINDTFLKLLHRLRDYLKHIQYAHFFVILSEVILKTLFHKIVKL